MAGLRPDVRIVDPTGIKDWDGLIASARDLDIFYTSMWARTLADTYGYRPMYLACMEPGAVRLLMPLMEVRSRVTGSRGVSLPFTDRCDTIFVDPGLFQEALRTAKALARERGWRYLEWRGKTGFPADTLSSEAFYEHTIELSPRADSIFRRFRDSNKRNIKKASKAGLEVKFYDSVEALIQYYRLHCVTRREHGLPPQPLSFFRNLHRYVISSGYGFTALALEKGRPIAGAVFLHFGRRAIYKYGASAKEKQVLRPNNLIMWEAVRRCCDKGFEELSLGRTETWNHGLLQFKQGWGAVESIIRYYRLDIASGEFVKNSDNRLVGRHNKLLGACPIPLLRTIGTLLYRHMA